MLQMWHFFLNLLVKKFFFFFLNVAIEMATLNLIPRVHVTSFVIALPNLVKYSTFSGCF
jgi:hypothetical protein